MAEPVRVLGFAGSLRVGSRNRSLLQAAVGEAPEDMILETYDIADVPLYNYDLEVHGDPDPIRRFKESIAAADGLLIATPEYNHSVAGVTKNAVDWISRPAGRSVLAGRPVAVMGASPGPWGTARAQVVLRQSFAFTNSYVMPQPQLLVPHAADVFDDRGRLTDERVRKALHGFLEAFGDWIRMFPPIRGRVPGQEGS